MTAVASAAAAPTTTGNRHHRLSSRRVVLALLVFQLVVGVVGALLAHSGSHAAPAAPSLPAGHAGAGTQPPAASGLGSDAATQASVLQTGTFSVAPTAGWKVLRQTHTEAIIASPSGDGILRIVSGGLSEASTLVDATNAYLRSITHGSPDAHICIKATSSHVPNGPAGILVGVCETVTPTNGRAFDALHLVDVGINGPGNTLYAVDLFTLARTSVLQHFAGEARPVLASIQWKLG